MVDHRAVHQLARLVIDAVLIKRATEALHTAATDLLVSQLRINHASAVLHHPMLEKLHKAGVGIYLHMGAMHAIGEDVEIICQMEAPRVGERGLGAARQLSQLEVADTSDLRKRQPLGATDAPHHGTLDDVETGRIGLQQLAGQHEDLLAQVARRPADSLAADRNGARAERAATVGDCIGVARHQATANHRAIDAHRACPADAILATQVRAREAELDAQEVNQMLAHGHAAVDTCTVDRKGDGNAFLLAHHATPARTAAGPSARRVSTRCRRSCNLALPCGLEVGCRSCDSAAAAAPARRVAATGCKRFVRERRLLLAGKVDEPPVRHGAAGDLKLERNPSDRENRRAEAQAR
jgi:hypothetical protein